MTISTHTLLQIVVAIATTVGIAVAVTMALMAAGVLYQRAQARGAKPGRGGAAATLQATQPDADRDLVLR